MHGEYFLGSNVPHRSLFYIYISVLFDRSIDRFAVFCSEVSLTGLSLWKDGLPTTKELNNDLPISLQLTFTFIKRF